MVCPMRFFLVAASAAVALLSALAGLLGWTRPKGGKYGGNDSDEESSGGEEEDVGKESMPSPRARRRKQENPQNGSSQQRHDDPRSARQLAAVGLSALWDAFTGKYLAVKTRDLWRAASSRSASPQPLLREQKKEERRGLRSSSSKAE